jgi:methylenetetrahydrofolate--tRNA-(uracil-5-)-methyltransferase
MTDTRDFPTKPASQGEVTVIGGGLAGTEAAWQMAERGFRVRLYEMRPVRTTGAHVGDRLGELVCSNSFGSKLADRASGMLKAELDHMGSLLLRIAEETALPAGGALAVDREAFAQAVTARIEAHPQITVVREEVTALPEGPTVIATGPLTSPALADAVRALTGSAYLYFYDAIAPIVAADSIDMSIAFRGNRYGRGDDAEGDYINCPMTREEYDLFVSALLAAPRAALHAVDHALANPADAPPEAAQFFEGCLPVEQLAARGHQTLAFGPMRPVGLRDPRTDRRPYAVVQLRRDNAAGSLYNLVGFQTNLKWGDQEKVLRLIPGLASAEFVRMGQMHRNTFINAPTLLTPALQYHTRPDLYFAGQITGVEGYMGNVATGLLAGINLARHLTGREPLILPGTSMLGALCQYITHAEAEHFQPMKANFGILPEIAPPIHDKRLRYAAYVERGLNALREAVDAAGEAAAAPA